MKTAEEEVLRHEVLRREAMSTISQFNKARAGTASPLLPSSRTVASPFTASTSSKKCAKLFADYTADNVTPEVLQAAFTIFVNSHDSIPGNFTQYYTVHC